MAAVELNTGPYIEYHAGTGLPLVLGCPHGGSLTPASIPNRNPDTSFPLDISKTWPDTDMAQYISRKVCLQRDHNTSELALFMAEELQLICGQKPHIIINNLNRKKMDANRDCEVATFGVPEAEVAWHAYHRCIEHACSSVSQDRALFVDVHGQNHAEQWIELGYMIPGARLASGNYHSSESSIHNQTLNQNIPTQLQDRLSPQCDEASKFQELLSGPYSLGGLLSAHGYKVVPSPTHLSPQGGSYYSGGYNTLRYGSRYSSKFDAIQIESPKSLRSRESLQDYGRNLAKTLYQYLQIHYAV